MSRSYLFCSKEITEVSERAELVEHDAKMVSRGFGKRAMRTAQTAPSSNPNRFNAGLLGVKHGVTKPLL